MANWILSNVRNVKHFKKSIFQSYLDFSSAKDPNFAIDISQSPGSNLQNIHQNPIFKMAAVQFPVQPSTIQSQDIEMTR